VYVYVCVLQLPLRACAWEPAPGGVVRPVTRRARREATLADLAAVGGAALAAATHTGVAATLGALLFAAAVIWHISAAHDNAVPPLQQAADGDALGTARIGG
jgi:hypothetical protein